ncbi:SGNH/GDSL hydrolase family protein [Mucilaginibacter sp. RCC_168]|uniref:SGNH/GDSL hydrolase family protein n=1 Tax=Mucilaginibacter sp. RCC_168 TaxID=3239221 RepID=UPI003524C840
MATSEDKPITGQPVASHINAASKTLGIDENDNVVLFPLSLLTYNRIGAFKTTDPAPAPALLNQHYDLIGTGANGANPSGTYTNLLKAAGTPIVIPAPAAGNGIFDAIAVFDGTFYQPFYQEKPLPAAVNKIPSWVAQVYSVADQVNYLGKDWTANAATLSTDIPGTSSKWTLRLSGYDTDISTVSAVANKSTISDYATPPVFSQQIVNDVTQITTNQNFTGALAIAPTNVRVSTTGYVYRFRVKLTNAEIGRKVKFYLLREVTTNNFLVVYDSGQITAEAAGINTYNPPLGSVKALANDVVCCLVQFVSSANGMAWFSGSGNLATTVYFSTALVQGSTYAITGNQSNAAKFAVDMTIYTGDLLVSRHWSNKPNGYLMLEGDPQIPQSARIPQKLLPSQISATSSVAVESTKYLADQSSNAIVKTFGSVDNYNFKPAYTSGRQYNVGLANKIIIGRLTATPGFLNSGILTELRIGPNATVVSTGKLQAWIVNINTTTNMFDLVAKVGEITANVAEIWQVFRGLSIFVNAGDLIAFRGIDIAPSFHGGDSGTTPYSYVNITSTDLTLSAFDNSIAVPAWTNGAIWKIEADIYNIPLGAKGIVGGNVAIDANGNIPANIGRKAEMYWQQQKIIWVGTSIPAGNSSSGGGAGSGVSYPVLVGQGLDAQMDNQAVGSSNIVWNGTSNLSLSATAAELTAAFGAAYAQYSYENKIIGKGNQLLVLDHGHNDRATLGNLGTLPFTSRPGTITSTTSSATVTGVGTNFTTQLKVGDKLYNQYFQYIGKILSIESATSLTLAANALVAVTGTAYNATSMDRATFYGAFNYIIDKARADNNLISIVFVTPPCLYSASGTDVSGFTALRTALFALANAYGVPICDLMKLADYNPANISLRTVDGTHPTPAERVRLANILYNFIKGVV